MKKSGFTLLEVIIVIIIIGVLASLALPKLFSIIEGVYAAEVISMMSTIRSAMERCYLMSNQSYLSCNSYSLIGLEHPSFNPGSHFSYFQPSVTGDGLSYLITAYNKQDDKKRIQMGVGYKITQVPAGVSHQILSDGIVYWYGTKPYSAFLPKH
jgi:prepilin-type N-terminal cleavage/methylation domain-containing protein